MSPSRPPPPPPELGFAETVKVTVACGELPEEFAQVRTYVSVPVVVGVKVWLPLAASVPLQEPDAVQLVAVGDDQVIVVVLPTAIAVADRLSVGVVGTGSVTVKVWEAAGELPTTFVHTSE